MWPLRLRQLAACVVILLPVVVIALPIKLASPSPPDLQPADRTFGSASTAWAVARDLVAEPGRLEPRLVVHQVSGTVGQPVPLGITVEGVAEGADVIITGTIPGMTFSSGTPMDSDTWQLAATGLEDTWVGPPRGFVGAVELSSELRLVGDRLVDRQPIRIEWASGITSTVPERSDTLAEDAPTVTHLVASHIRKGAEQIGASHHGHHTVVRAAKLSISTKGAARRATRSRSRAKPVYAIPTQLTRASIPGW
jgi:hypothetical protein